ncbi:hypothetical protein OHE73_10145 [Escherichia coli]|nr:hypothetical protein [Escherichia coli]MCV2955795.1 hypothetical protein [Escherichia coli]
MWILIFWLSSPFNVSYGDARQPTLAVHSQEFRTENDTGSPVGVM